MTVAEATAQTPAQLREEILRLVAEYAAMAHAPKRFDPATSPVPVSGRVYGAPEMVSLVDSALDFWLTTGRFNEEFERELGLILGRKHVLTVNSGSSANLVALASLTSHLLKDRALKPGDEVITCATGFPTTVNPVVLYGLVPVFLDVDIPTYNIETAQLEEALSPRTRAVMVAHTLGNPFAVDKVMEFARRHDLFVIEDSCDALGARFDGQPVGTFGDIGTLSFYPAHHITMGEGGAVFTETGILRRAMESIRDWGRDCYCAPGMDNTCKRRFEWQLGELPRGFDHKYCYSHLGYNLKITDMQAAVGLAQLPRLDGFVEARRRNFERLVDGLREMEEVLVLPEATAKSEPSWFGLPLTVREDAPFSRDALVRHLNSRRIGTRYLFGGNLIRQPYMIGREFRTVGDLANADIVMRQTFWIGVYPGLADTHIDYMVDTISSFVRSPVAGK
jgi:CDP-6-deoxy-D-xylo-4-hexulose-3-dehydrase